MSKEAHNSAGTRDADDNSSFLAPALTTKALSSGAAALAAMSPEQRAAAREKGRLARATNVAARAASPLRRDFLDDDFWVGLARRYGVRLPAWGTPITSGGGR